MEQQTKNMTCEKCGHDELAFVSVTRSERKFSFFIIIVLLLCFGAGIFLWEGISSGMEAMREQKVSEITTESIFFLWMLIQSLISIITFGITIGAFYLLTPYKNKNAIYSVCKCCGNTDLIHEEKEEE